MTDQEEREIMDEFFETNSYDHVVDWRLMPHLGEGDDDEDEDDLRGLGGVGSGHFGHSGGEGGPGNPGGSDSGGISIVKKAKAPNATKEQIETAVKMKEQGASYAKIEAETGLNPKQAATIVFKHKKAQAAALKEITAKPSTITKKVIIPGQPAIFVDENDKAVSVSQLTEAGYTFSNKDGWTKAAPPAVVVSPPTPSSLIPETPGSITPPNELALAGKGYVWQEKKTGPAKGKYAFFKDGIQVSANAQNDLEGKTKAAASINFGKGPDYVAPKPLPPPPKPGAYKGSDLIADVVGKVEEVHPWPIDDNAERKIGSSKYVNSISDRGNEFSSKLTADERHSVVHYTGSAATGINQSLRNGKVPDKAKSIDSALAKAPKPPPPDLVWRGIPGVSQHSLISSLESGDVIRLSGFQSTSISPERAASWSSGQTLFEIKVTHGSGAYVGNISSYPAEKEFILPRGRQYRVRGATKVKIGKSLRQIIQLEMLP